MRLLSPEERFDGAALEAVAQTRGKRTQFSSHAERSNLVSAICPCCKSTNSSAQQRGAGTHGTFVHRRGLVA